MSEYPSVDPKYIRRLDPRQVEGRTWVRIFDSGIDWDVLIEVSYAAFYSRRRVELMGNLLCRDNKGRLLISFAEMRQNGRDYPVWLPRDLVTTEICPEIIDAETGEIIPQNRMTHYIPVQEMREIHPLLPGERRDPRAPRATTGRIFETNTQRFGWGYFTLPVWLAGCLDQLTAEGLRQRHADMAEVKEAEKRRRAAASLRKQTSAAMAAIGIKPPAKTKKPRSKRNPGQGELL